MSLFADSLKKRRHRREAALEAAIRKEMGLTEEQVDEMGRLLDNPQSYAPDPELSQEFASSGCTFQRSGDPDGK